ncbi:MAG: DUF2589 domain-containing protein [Halorubrum sp.]
MPNPDFNAELASIPYEHVIGEPLRAAVEANASASQTAAEYIMRLGFTDPVVGNQEPVMVDFTYNKQVVDEESGETVTEVHVMSVPLLLLLHIPYFEVENVTIDFNVKLNSVDAYARSTQFEFDSSREAEGGLNIGFMNGKTKSSVNVGAQFSTRRGQEVKRAYDQRVRVEAGSIEPPEGASQVLTALETAITDTVEE